MTKAKLFSLVAELIQSLLDTGYDEQSLIYMLKQYGISAEQAKEWYGIPYDEND